MSNEGFLEKGMRGESFRPPLAGVVSKDLSLARQVGALYRETGRRALSLQDCSLACIGQDSATRGVLEALSADALYEACLLGELCMALGGGVSGARRCGMREERSAERLREEAARESRRRIERYEAMLSQTGDRVVRSVLSRLIGIERRMERLAHEG